MMNKNFSSEAQRNLTTIINLLKHRLQSQGKTKSLDEHGNTVYIDCDIYSVEMLESFVELSISEFNQTPHFTNFTPENSRFMDCFKEILVEGATLYALSSQALIERGREFQLTDDGLHFNPPNISEMLSTQYSTLLSHHWDKLKTIKQNISEFEK